jgi:FkbM family methyltransferase
MKHALARWFRRSLNLVPRSAALLKLCRMYVNFYNGQDNPDFRTNGEARALRRLLPRCDVVLDVGAHVGDWTALALSINPGLAIHCFEPSASTYSQLAARHGGAANVKLNPMGLSAEPGEARLHLFQGQSDTSSLYAGAGFTPSAGTETIRLDTLDRYCDANQLARIDYLKIDTEGHEFAVLRGAQTMLGGGRIAYVQLEYGPGYLEAGVLLRDVFHYLCPMGYRPHRILPRGLEPVTAYSVAFENFRLSNWLFAHSSAGNV